MELLPILDVLDSPKEGLWYSLVPAGSAPGVSVGHTCSFVPSTDEGNGRIIIIGGADPSGSFSHSHVIDLDNHQWVQADWTGLESRYEHCSFVPDCCPQSLWVFGGAQQTGNRNTIQKIQLSDSDSHWRNIQTNGDPPCPRTYHTSSACLGDKLYVFSGGEAGASPVADQKLHIFDTVGMLWKKVKAKGDLPPAVAAHSSVALGNCVYIFGGMTPDGASNSMYKFVTDKCKWVLMRFEGDLPPNRLDHSMCLVPWKIRDAASSSDESADCQANSNSVNLVFIYAGMDTQGVIHNDCVVTVVT
ncbi:rab9 effector protein with kelch motifs isoform X2 [Synchiropus splendidus]|uniref:rab9 effector protein with kelch motifs isoform X2 n=1 Tax=Synchiropus splendidus TaxID=270530 RepID=UPI00237E488D|nr:rab9 effector protein with kelch motifs isoform X2 [Synchiropus splendidus]